MEIIGVTNNGSAANVSISVELFAGPAPSEFRVFLLTNGAPITFLDNYGKTGGGTCYGHANAENALAIGAARYDQTPPFGISPALLEPFSSAGGIPLYFNDNGTPKGAPVTGFKPWVTGPDGANTTFFRGNDFEADGFPNFFGTSASAPHVAALATLILDANGSLTPTQVSAILQNNALEMLTPGFDFQSGYGFVDGLESVREAACGDDPIEVAIDPVVYICEGETAADLYFVSNGGDTE